MVTVAIRIKPGVTRPERERGRRTGAARVLPLRFSRQTERPTGRRETPGRVEA